MRVLLTLGFLLVLSVCAHAQSELETKYIDMKKYLNIEKYAEAIENADYILSHMEQNDENLENYGRISFMKIYALAGQVANGTKHREEVRPIIESAKGIFVVLPIKKLVIGDKAPGIHVDLKKPESFWVGIPNKKRTSILCSCFVKVREKYHPEALDGKYVLIGGIVRDISLGEGNLKILTIDIDPAEVHEFKM